MNRTPDGKTALIVGATGLVGGACLRLLLAADRYTRVRVLLRRPFPELPASPRLEVQVVEFDRPETYAGFLGADHLYCTLGTTIKTARTRQAFRRVDFEIPLAVAEGAREQGASHFLLVSAIGANPHSRTFYSRVKGELEEALLALHYPSVTILRPSLLLGKRTERRLGEELGALATPLIPLRWKPVPALVVAEALVAAAGENRQGVHIIENLELQRRSQSRNDL